MEGNKTGGEEGNKTEEAGNVYQEIVEGERGGEHLQNWEVLTYFRRETSTEIFKLPRLFQLPLLGLPLHFNLPVPLR